VITCAAELAPTTVEANVRLAGESVPVNAAAAPVPVSATVCGEPVALSTTESDAARDPLAVGLNSTDTAQLAPAASALVQVLAEIK
jgi:hypothetical protein